MSNYEKLDLSQYDFNLKGFNMLQELGIWANSHYSSIFDGMSVMQIATLYFTTLNAGFDTYNQWLNADAESAESTYRTIKNSDYEALELIIREATNQKNYSSFLC
jgi:hypothetical protein